MSSISIALTTYNGGKYLRLQLDSLLKQTLPFDEIVICDDKSSDDTFNILQEYSRKDNRFKITLNETTLGFKKNFEKALSLCSGDYIALCDQDDIWLPNHLKILYDNIGSNKLICGASEIIDSEGKEMGCRFNQIQNYNLPDDCPNYRTLLFIGYYHGPFQGASMMLKKEFLGYILPIDEGIRFHDVWAVYVACLMDAFKFIDIPVTYYRLHNNNASGKYCKRYRVKTLLGHLFTNRLERVRFPMIEGAKARFYNILSEGSQNFLNQSENYILNTGSILGRVKNLIFELKNYKSIYGKK